MSRYGETLARQVDLRIAAMPADQTALQNVGPNDRADGQVAFVLADQTAWQFVLASSAGANAGQVIVPADNPSAGRWLRVGASVVSSQIAPPADLTALKAIPASQRSTGVTAMLQSDGSTWRFAASSTLTGDDLLVATPAAGTGRWIRCDNVVDLKLAVLYSDANNTTKYTVPAGFRLRPTVPFWEVTTAFTTGATGAAGFSSSNASFNTAGDLLGGASLDAAASLTSGLIGGTVGAKIGAPSTVLVGGNTLLWNKSSTFTAGAGYAHVPVEVLLAPAA